MTDRDSASADDSYPEWGFNEVDPEIETAPWTIEANGETFSFDKLGRADADSSVFVDTFTPDGILAHGIGIADSEQNVVRQEIRGANGNATFDLSESGDGERLAPGTYAIANATIDGGEPQPRAVQPLCVQAYTAEVVETVDGPNPEVTVEVATELVENPPPIEQAIVLVWDDQAESQADSILVPLQQTDGDTYHGTFPTLAANQYNLHAVLGDTTEGLVPVMYGLSDVTTVTVPVAQIGLSLEVDGQGDGVVLQEGETVPYTVLADYNDGTQQDVTGEVDISVEGDAAVVDIDESNAQITGNTVGAVTVEADDGSFTDTTTVVVAGDGVVVATPDRTISPGETATFDLAASEPETLVVEKLWTDWTVTASDPDGATPTDNVATAGEFVLDWGAQQQDAAPSVGVEPPPEYIGGEFELTVSATGADGSTATDSAILTIEPSLL